MSPELGRPQQGPNIPVPPTLGDESNPQLESDELVQTYFVSADLPNVLFAAPRASTVIFDGTVWTRPDGALRSDTTLTDGSVYTVVSQRVSVTPELLRAQGDVSDVFATFTDGGSQAILAPYLELPTSTSARTIALADDLAQPGRSTYDTVLAYEGWIGANTAYDLNAPVPEPGTNAVDDFLFESQRGFCEQIASALTMMLRSQGVPARLATGYLPGERDRVSGVWKVRARDAHAWVEVWFPETGWQAFDPTASVPLAGDADAGTVGGDLVAAATSSVASHGREIGGVMFLALLGVGLVRIAAELRRRHRRGRWGLLQDRFTELTDRHRSSDHGVAMTNPRRGDLFCEAFGGDAAVEQQVAIVVEALDRAAFDPLWSDNELIDTALNDTGSADRRSGARPRDRLRRTPPRRSRRWSICGPATATGAVSSFTRDALLHRGKPFGEPRLLRAPQLRHEFALARPPGGCRCRPCRGSSRFVTIASSRGADAAAGGELVGDLEQRLVVGTHL